MPEATWSRRAILILSDGMDNHSRYLQEELLNAALEGDVQVYTILMAPDSSGGSTTKTSPYRPTLVTKPWNRAEERQGPEMLKNLSDRTGGLYFRASNNNEAKEYVIKVGQALHNEYVIGYRPPDPGTSLRWHKIRVKSKQSMASVHARNGYYSR
jgi:Ca-activated chloride channel family protein